MTHFRCTSTSGRSIVRSAKHRRYRTLEFHHDMSQIFCSTKMAKQPFRTATGPFGKAVYVRSQHFLIREKLCRTSDAQLSCGSGSDRRDLHR